MARKTELKPEELVARDYADRLILSTLTELNEVVKPSEVSDRLQSQGLGLAAVRSLLASNPSRFAYAERRWIPAARVASIGRPVHEFVRTTVDRFGGPMSIDLLAVEVARVRHEDPLAMADAIRRMVRTDESLFITLDDRIALNSFVFVANDESPERAFQLNGVTEEEVAEVQNALGKFDWMQTDAILRALDKVSPVGAKALGAAAWLALSPQGSDTFLMYDWRSFNAELLSVPGFVYSSEGKICPESMTKQWLSAAVKLADKVTPAIEFEDAAPIELKKADIENLVKAVATSEDTVTATRLLEQFFEITPTVKTFPDDMQNVMAALKADPRVWWVGGDRFRAPGSAPEFIYEMPEPFQFVQTPYLQEDGDPVDVELTDEGLSTSLRKLIAHPLATDVNDEDEVPEPKNMPESMRLVLKPIHRELGTFPLAQFPTTWFDRQPAIQEIILIDGQGRELQTWLNNDARLIFGLFDWWLDQPVESGAVFTLTKTHKPNVLEFAWLDQTDPVVYISSQRMDELREIAHRADEMSTFDILREVMTHWPKGADFLTTLWEVNVVRRTSRRLLASLLSSYVCFYQRSGSPVWHYDHKKVEQGFDKTKKKFVVKRDGS
ncbi:MAG: hypothetical protein KIT11_09160 [Fimbriimonadaceae bacterium]|nr:hypothetical protein [Fimbriimonadaceae bacterium]QYK55496.1 MAG: hypothetical protein KF733_10830 [Fimbriimonadaceae bacterium]